MLVAARVAPETARVGIIPVATTTHTEPFHVSKAIATLDYVSRGRAGFQARISPTSLEAAQFGRRHWGLVTNAVDGSGERARSSGLMDEAADFVEVVRRLWDSWEDDAEIRDVATGRFVDRDKLHYIDFEGPWFSVRVPPSHPVPHRVSRSSACWRTSTRPSGWPPARRMWCSSPLIRGGRPSPGRPVRQPRRGGGRAQPPLRVVADLRRLPRRRAGAAVARKERLDRLDGQPLRSDALIFSGTPAELVDLLEEWQSVGIEGFRLRPGAHPA